MTTFVAVSLEGWKYKSAPPAFLIFCNQQAYGHKLSLGAHYLWYKGIFVTRTSCFLAD